MPSTLAGSGTAENCSTTSFRSDATANHSSPYLPQWGPMEKTAAGKGDPTRMQFPSEFEWISPSGKGLLTAYMTDHYGSGWGMDSAPTLEAAGEAAYQEFLELKKVTTARHVLLPVGGDYTPPNKWVTALHKAWAEKYVWPRFVCSLPRDFVAAERRCCPFFTFAETRAAFPSISAPDLRQFQRYGASASGSSPAGCAVAPWRCPIRAR